MNNPSDNNLRISQKLTVEKEVTVQPTSEPPSGPTTTTSSSTTSEPEFIMTPDGQKLDLSIMGNLSIPEKGQSPVKNSNRFKSMKFGLAGLIYLIVREQSIKAAAIVTVLVVGVGIPLHLDGVSWAILALAIGQVWVTECLNTAIESAINLGTDVPHPMAKIGKDVASAAALVSAFVLLAVILALFIPRLIARLHGAV